MPIFKELVRRGLSIDIYFRGHPLCDQSYRYIILENEAVDGYRRWRYNDLPHPLVKYSTFVSEDYAYYLMKMIEEVKAFGLPYELLTDAKINYIFAGAREDYVNRSLFDKIREKLINS